MANRALTFEVPEEVRAFAEKGVSQAHANYAKFKKVAQDGNGAIEAVQCCKQGGACLLR